MIYLRLAALDIKTNKTKIKPVNYSVNCPDKQKEDWEAFTDRHVDRTTRRMSILKRWDIILRKVESMTHFRIKSPSPSQRIIVLNCSLATKICRSEL